MIKVYVTDIASQMGVDISRVSVTGGLSMSCVDYILEVASKSHVVRTILHQSEFESIENGSSSGFIELKVRAAIERLKMLM